MKTCEGVEYPRPYGNELISNVAEADKKELPLLSVIS